MTVDDQPDADPRPTDLSPQQLGFNPQLPVGWLQPVQLSGTALRVLLSHLFGAYLDKRELQNTLPERTYDEGGDRDELWLDFVADLGDGFDPTYTVAYLLGRPSLTVDGHELPRGKVLMMGGDEVYPTASTQAYEDRTKGPYKAALPCADGGDQPQLYALPGNHDWYDGLTAFLRLFAKNETDSIGAWVNAQARSYFAISLPHRWWLLAIDTQFGAYLDDPQLRYFHDVAARFGPEDRIILCSPTPGWVEAEGDPSAYDAIDYFMRTVLEPTGATVKLMLSGDLHHYARYRGPDRDLITCGGGGAYLYATHRLPEQIPVPPPDSRSRKQSPIKDYTLQSTYPTKARSRRYALGIFTRTLAQNPSFMLLLGAVHMLYALALVEQFSHPSGVTQRLFSIPVGIMGVAMLAGTTFFAMPQNGVRRPRHWLFGTGHGIVHIGLGTLGAWLWLHLPFTGWVWPLPVVAAVVVYLPLSGLVATELFCLYLLLASSAGVNLNELFASQSIVDSKCFLRLHFERDGSLTIYPIAIDRVGRQWVARPDARRASDPWIEPTSPIGTRLIEQPIRIS
jgi:Calcineurin-like phosphoesterase